MSNMSWWFMCDMDSLSNDSQQEHRFPLLELPAEARNVIYRCFLDDALPNLILPRWMHSMQRWHEYTTSHPIATGCLATSSFTNLQLVNRQVYREASYILYQDCQFSFNIAPRHASFLDGCLLSGSPNWDIHHKGYIYRIEQIVLKANWDQYDWAHIRGFDWANWKDITSMVCRELLGFSALRKLTLDWRESDPCDVLQPTADQWLSISPYFERLHAKRPIVSMEVLARQRISGSVPFQHRNIRVAFEEYPQELQRATETPRVSLPIWENPSYQSPSFVLGNSRYSQYSNLQWPPIPAGPSHKPAMLPNSRVHGSHDQHWPRLQ